MNSMFLVFAAGVCMTGANLSANASSCAKTFNFEYAVGAVEPQAEETDSFFRGVAAVKRVEQGTTAILYSAIASPQEAADPQSRTKLAESREAALRKLFARAKIPVSSLVLTLEGAPAHERQATNALRGTAEVVILYGCAGSDGRV